MSDKSLEILEKLVAFPSVSGLPTHEIIKYIKNFFEDHGLDVVLSHDEKKERSNIFTTIGPREDGGVLLNGHTDVVAVEGQNWKTDPFKLTKIDQRLFGRGSVDMKGFLACAMASIPFFQSRSLKKPIHLAFTFDEETGGFGMPVLLESLKAENIKPEIIIVGEPTEMNIVTSHKGGDEMRTEITGFEVHSCDPERGVSAISAAMKVIAKIEEIGLRLSSNPYKNSLFEPPFGTFNVGTIEGGAARNATAGWCNFDWEFRPMPGEDNKKIISEIKEYVSSVVLPPMQKVNKQANIKIITEVSVPSFDDRLSEKAANFVSEVTGKNSRGVVSFGTDAGYFSDGGYSTVVCGPGTISRAHAPDEYITVEEMKQGMKFMKDIATKLAI